MSLWTDEDYVLVWTEMDDEQSEWIVLTPTWIDSISLDLLEYNKKAVNVAMIETEYTEAAHS